MKLTDELNRLRQWAASGPTGPEAAGRISCPVEPECARIRAAWTKAGFLTLTDECLKRYYTHHLRILSEIADLIGADPESNLSNEVLALTCHLLKNYPAYLDVNVTAPMSYQRVFAAGHSRTLTTLVKNVKSSPIAGSLKKCLLAFTDEMAVADPLQRFTFRSLLYFERWMVSLSGLDFRDSGVETVLHAALELLNFNNLSYVRLRQDMMAFDTGSGTQIRNHYYERNRLAMLPAGKSPACRPDWPALSTMLLGWITEEIAYQTTPHHPAQQVPSKYPMDLSVAHMGCLLQLLCGAAMPGKRNLVELFDFVTTHFTSKRQEKISAQSLRKEYYGVTQVTAAKVQGMLEQMISLLKQKYFPLLAWLAIHAALHFYPGN